MVRWSSAYTWTFHSDLCSNGIACDDSWFVTAVNVSRACRWISLSELSEVSELAIKVDKGGKNA